MILLLLTLWRELLLNNTLKKQNYMHFLALCNEIYFLANFFLQTNHLRKFLEFRVGMGIVDNMIAKCKYMTIGVLVQLMDLICLNLK
jgi:hypothetical protein